MGILNSEEDRLRKKISDLEAEVEGLKEVVRVLDEVCDQLGYVNRTVKTMASSNAVLTRAGKFLTRWRRVLQEDSTC